MAEAPLKKIGSSQKCLKTFDCPCCYGLGPLGKEILRGERPNPPLGFIPQQDFKLDFSQVPKQICTDAGTFDFKKFIRSPLSEITLENISSIRMAKDGTNLTGRPLNNWDKLMYHFLTSSDMVSIHKDCDELKKILIDMKPAFKFSLPQAEEAYDGLIKGYTDMSKTTETYSEALDMLTSLKLSYHLMLNTYLDKSEWWRYYILKVDEMKESLSNLDLTAGQHKPIKLGVDLPRTPIGVPERKFKPNRPTAFQLTQKNTYTCDVCKARLGATGMISYYQLMLNGGARVYPCVISCKKPDRDAPTTPIPVCSEFCCMKAYGIGLALDRKYKTLTPPFDRSWTLCLSCGLEFRKRGKCGRCRVARYCSKICQTNDWNFHKHYCRMLELNRKIAAVMISEHARAEYEADKKNKKGSDESSDDDVC